MVNCVNYYVNAPPNKKDPSSKIFNQIVAVFATKKKFGCLDRIITETNSERHVVFKKFANMFGIIAFLCSGYASIMWGFFKNSLKYESIF